MMEMRPGVAGVMGLLACLLLVLMSAHPTHSFGHRRPYMFMCLSGDASPRCPRLEAQNCYDTENRVFCCETCAAFKRQFYSGDDCAYGDHDPEECRLVRYRHCSGRRTREQCCGTCAKMFKIASGKN